MRRPQIVLLGLIALVIAGGIGVIGLLTRQSENQYAQDVAEFTGAFSTALNRMTAAYPAGPVSSPAWRAAMADPLAQAIATTESVDRLTPPPRYSHADATLKAAIRLYRQAFILEQALTGPDPTAIRQATADIQQAQVLYLQALTEYRALGAIR